ncbi:MAG: hypothetical protein K6F35_10235 [Lachnospiraceae bacterium]|nr:hypothetical protein [Lachnospiraceae bacterium]
MFNNIFDAALYKILVLSRIWRGTGQSNKRYVMLNIIERNEEDLSTLKHGINVFHDALSKVREGETRFHVTDETDTVPDYDLVYMDNMLLFPEQTRAIVRKMTNGGTVYSPFLSYDEDDEENLCLDFLKQFRRIEIESADEYSIVFALVALKHSDIPIYYTDERFGWFLGDSHQLNKVESLPVEKEKNDAPRDEQPLRYGIYGT